MMKCINYCLLVSVIATSIFCSAANAQSVQRFFTTLQERQMLENTRVNAQQHLPIEQKVSGKKTGIVAITPLTLTLTGLVLKENNDHTIWLNGHALNVGELPPGVRINVSTAKLLQLDPGKRGFSVVSMGDTISVIDRDYIQLFGALLNSSSSIKEVAQLNQQEGLQHSGAQEADEDELEQSLLTANDSPL